MLSLSFINATNNVTWPDTSIQATECALYYCVNEYSSKVLNGFLAESATEIATARRSYGSWQPTNTKNSSYQDPLFLGNSHFVRRTDLMLGHEYNISQAGIDGIYGFFQRTVLVTNDLKTSRMAGMATHSNTFMPNWTLDTAQGQEPYVWFIPEAMQPFFASASLAEIFDSIAWSISNAIRVGADQVRGKESCVTGQNGVTVTQYAIQWPWISLPITLILASYTFLLLGVYFSHKAKVPAWKSSSLAILARGSCVSNQLRDTTTISGMEDKAESTFARLIDFGNLEILGTSLADISQAILPLSRQSSPLSSSHVDLQKGRDSVHRVSQDLSPERDVSEVDEDNG
ncbi:MAG: hypothetical protein Q9165_000678 [Trypethelium subeluteriae]